jgi:hyaluronate lyase
LKDITLAYATKGSTLENNLTLKADIISALNWMNSNRYYFGATPYNNWWWFWKIG